MAEKLDGFVKYICLDIISTFSALDQKSCNLMRFPIEILQPFACFYMTSEKSSKSRIVNEDTVASYILRVTLPPPGKF